MALLFEQDPTIGAPDGKEWVRNVESGNVYAVDRETAQNADIYEEPGAKAIASRYANQFEEGFRIGIPTGQTGDFEEELQEREVTFDESFDGEEKTHYIFTTAEDYESAENARKTLQTEIAMKLKKIIRETAKDVIQEGSFPEARDGKVWVYNTNSNDVYAVEKETAEEGDQYKAPEKHMIPGTDEYEKKRKMPKFCVEPNKASEFVKGMEDKGFSVDEDPNAKPADKMCFRPKENSAEVNDAANDIRDKIRKKSESRNKAGMKLTESKLRNIVREELSNLLREGRFDDMEPTWKDDLPNPNRSVPDETKKNVSSSFPSAEDGKVFAYDQENDRIQQVTPQTAEKKDKYRKPKPKELENYNESVSKLKNLIRQEIARAGKKKGRSAVNELSFREDKMRELLTREPKLDRIRQEEGHSLKTMFDMYVLRNKEMKRQYKQASPQP